MCEQAATPLSAHRNRPIKGPLLYLWSGSAGQNGWVACEGGHGGSDECMRVLEPERHPGEQPDVGRLSTSPASGGHRIRYSLLLGCRRAIR